MSVVALSLLYSGALVILSRSWLGDVKTWVEDAVSGTMANAIAKPPANTPGGKGQPYAQAPGVGKGGGGGGGGSF